jgi:hypothetical protein
MEGFGFTASASESFPAHVNQQDLAPLDVGHKADFNGFSQQPENV